jgi:hypothetical protein
VSFPLDLHSEAVFESHIRPIHTYHALVCVNQTRPHCVNQMGKNGMAGERHGMCESAFRMQKILIIVSYCNKDNITFIQKHAFMSS